MFKALGHFVVTRRKGVLGLFLVALVGIGSIGISVFSRLDSGGYSDPNSESATVESYLEDTFNVKDPAVVIVVKSPVSVDDPAVAATGLEIEEKLAAEPSVERTLSYWSSGFFPVLKSEDGRSAYILGYLKTADFSTIDALGAHYLASYSGRYKDVELLPSGLAIVANSINGKMQDDIKAAEWIAVPLTFILLLYVFGAVVAAAMPVIIGLTSVIGAFFMLYLITHATDVSIFAINLVSALGLGLGVDYALLIVNRFREELHTGNNVEASIITTLSTAGKTVFFSGMTLITTLVSLTFFPQNFLKSMGYAGISVVALAVFCALIPLPAILALMGGNVDKGVVLKNAITPERDGGWAKIARWVMRHPVLVVVVTGAILSLFVAPITNLQFGQVDSRVLPKDHPAASAARFISENFTGQEGHPIEIIIPNAPGQSGAILDFVDGLREVPGIVRIGKMEVVGEDARLTAIHSMPPRTTAAQDLINDVRALKKPVGTLIGGDAADYTDTQDAISKTLPWVMLWIASVVLILLFLFTGSVFLPVKAVLLNIVSIAATIGFVTWIFIDGHMRWLIGDFTITGALDTGAVIVIAIVAFGLSMDYELFLLSRIKEKHEDGRSNIESVARGLQRSGRIITSAALLLAVAFGSFCISGVTTVKMLGIGATFSILVDATIIRAFLVPALMRLLGDRCWWAPKFLKRLTGEPPPVMMDYTKLRRSNPAQDA
jgi:RND superfamily putative drug exporter